MSAMSVRVRHHYSIQAYIDPDGSGKRWLETSESPSITRDDITEEDGWIARLDYLRAVRSETFRLVKFTTQIEESVIA
jgi:hypothetical protein